MCRTFIAGFCLTFCIQIHSMDNNHAVAPVELQRMDKEWSKIVTLAQKAEGQQPAILAYFSGQLALSKPFRDLKFIHLQTGIHNLRGRSVPDKARTLLLKHLWLAQSQLEIAYLQQALIEEQERTAQLLEGFAATKETP